MAECGLERGTDVITDYTTKSKRAMQDLNLRPLDPRLERGANNAKSISFARLAQSVERETLNLKV
ncbi:hypothetical protein H8356DRAFT_1438709, partial [Neocallimastix lanati (nom. inval.)]